MADDGRQYDVAFFAEEQVHDFSQTILTISFSAENDGPAYLREYSISTSMGSFTGWMRIPPLSICREI